MKRNTIFGRPVLPLFTLLVILSLLAGCNLPASSGGVSVWIDVPLDGLIFPDVQAINIEGHAASPGGVSRVEIWINGALLVTINDPPTEGELASFHAEWTPSAPGEYTIQAITFGADGTASAPDSARVTFGGAVTPTTVGGCPTPVGGGPTPVSCIPAVSGCPTPVGGGPTPVSCEPVGSGCPTPVGGGPTPVSCGPQVSGCPSPVGGGPTPVSCITPVIPVVPVITDTPTSPPGAVVQFWADPANVAAGACTTIRWHAENVQRVIFGGIDQPFDGSYRECLCESQRYTLRVIHLDSSEEKRTVDIAVTGTCATPTFTPLPPTTPTFTPPPPDTDTTPPPVPTPAVPADGLTLSCRSSQNLVWLPVSDPSGISGYYVKLEMEVTPGNWQSAGGYGPVTDKQVNVTVQCGGIYRWMVRAQDGAGNYSSWSAPSRFSINLT